MIDLNFGPYAVRVNLERTRTYYALHPLPWVDCECPGCRNFTRAVKTLPQAVTGFYRKLGLDPLKPAEVCHYESLPDSVFTSAWYHVCGELVKGGPVPGQHARYGAIWKLADGVSVACCSDCDLLPDDFPQPCFQIEFWFERLPWLLDEPNPY
ncbi:MAG: hypothetical protein IJQ81_16475 [Oscillibacter sp.]|nr:hypothetical protein [Oscillibacter sp.]